MKPQKAWAVFSGAVPVYPSIRSTRTECLNWLLKEKRPDMYELEMGKWKCVRKVTVIEGWKP